MGLFDILKKKKIKQIDIKPTLEIENILSEKINSNDKIFFEKVVGTIINNEDLKNYFSIECDVDFVSKEILSDDLRSLTDFAQSNYDIEPFACDGSGGLYTILSNQKIGYIDSEGSAGIIADSLKEFFCIVTNCGCLLDYAASDCLKDEKTFLDYFNKYEISREKEIIKKFLEENSLSNDPNEIYAMFKKAVVTEPKLLLTTTSEDYVDYEQLFKF